MTPDDIRVLAGVITVFMSGGLVLAYVAYRKQKKQEPIDEETAAVINAKTAGELALALAKGQAESITVLRQDLTAVRTELHTTRDELATTRHELGQLRGTLTNLVMWVRDLFANWDSYRTMDRPPGGLPPGVL